MNTFKRILCLMLTLMLLLPAASAEEGLLILPAGTKRIEEMAFYGVEGISKAIVPEGAEEIGPLAFAWSTLSEITLPASISSISDDAFSGCRDLLVTAPEGSYARQWAADKGFLIAGITDSDPASFTYTLSNGEATVTGYNGSATEVTIPASLGGAPVTSIGMGAFVYNQTLTRVTLPEGLKTIGTQAFMGCRMLRSIHIPSSVTDIGLSPFAYCNALNTITLGSASQTYRLTDGVLFSADGKELLLYPNGSMRKSYAVPAGVERIEDEVFYCNDHLTAITLPEGLKEIGSYAFYSMQALRQISLPASLETLGDGALSSCNHLTAIDVTSGNAHFDSYDGVLYNAARTSLLAFPSGRTDELFTVPEGVTAIHASAFEDCGVSSVILPEGVTTLGDFAFAYSWNLSAVRLPSTLVHFGTMPFTDCENLTLEVVSGSAGETHALNNSIPHTTYSADPVVPVPTATITAEPVVTPEPTAPAEDPKGFDYIISDGEATITAYTGKASKVVIPSTLGGAPVRHIGESAFYCHELQELVLNDGLLTIGDEAFYGCDSLTSLTLPSSVQTLGENAFFSCGKLETAVLAGDLQTIGRRCFQECESLREVHLGAKVVFIGDVAFYLCTSLTSVTLEESDFVPYLTGSVGSSAFASCEKLERVNLPRSIASIGSYAFMNNEAMKFVVLPQNLTSIGEMAFSGCSAMEMLTVPKTVTSIGSSVFSGCNALTLYVTLGSEAESYANRYGIPVLYLGATPTPAPTIVPTPTATPTPQTYTVTWKNHDGTVLEQDVNVLYGEIPTYNGKEPEKKTDYGDSYVFSGWSPKVSAVKGNTIYTAQYTKTFGFTYSINNNEVTITGGSGSSTDIVIPEEIKNYPVTSIGNWAFADHADLRSIRIPYGITNIGEGAFSGISNITSISIPSSVTNIGYAAFSECSSLQSITIPYGVQHIRSSTFSKCTNLTNVSIPESVISIGDNAFGRCSSLASIYIPYGVSSIGESAFSNCSNLKSIHIPSSVMTIGNTAFWKCSSLTAVDISYGLKSIGKQAFDDCSNLISIDIPSSVTSIGDFAFMDCSSLPEINIPSGVRSIGTRVFEHCRALKKVEISNGITSIGDKAFYYCNSLESIRIPDGVTSIGESAFEYCTSLTSIFIPDSVKTIGNRAFSSCVSLTSADIPMGVKIIGDEVFYSCRSLINVNIPGSVTSIGESAFYYCRGLTRVDIPISVTAIGAYAFKDCQGLSVYIPKNVTTIGVDAFKYCTNIKLYVYMNSYAESYAKSYSIPYVCIDAPTSSPTISPTPTSIPTSTPSSPIITTPPPQLPEIGSESIPTEYFRILSSIVVDGNTYYKAELLKEYNGVFKTCGDQSFFFMSDEHKPVKDLDTLGKLWTVHMYVTTQDLILAPLARDLASVSAYYADTLQRFLQTDMLMKTLGSLAEGALKAALTGGASLWGDVLDILDKVTTSDNVFMVTEIMLAANFAYGAQTAAQAFSLVDATDGSGKWDYQRVEDSLSLFRNVYVLNQAVEGMCMPIVDDVLSEYSSGFEYAVANLGKMAASFFKAAVEDIALAEIDTFLRNWKTIDSARELLTGTIATLKSELPTGTQGWYNLMQTFRGLNESIEKLTGITDDEVEAFLAPMYLDLNESLDRQLYEAQLKLAE